MEISKGITTAKRAMLPSMTYPFWTMAINPTPEMNQQASRKARDRIKNLAFWGILSLFQTVDHRLATLKVKVGAVDTTDRMTTSQYTMVSTGFRYFWQMVRMGALSA